MLKRSKSPFFKSFYCICPIIFNSKVDNVLMVIFTLLTCCRVVVSPLSNDIYPHISIACNWDMLQDFFLELAFFLLEGNPTVLFLCQETLISYDPGLLLSCFIPSSPLESQWHFCEQKLACAYQTCFCSPNSWQLPRQSNQLWSAQLCPHILYVFQKYLSMGKPGFFHFNLHFVHYSDKFWSSESGDISWLHT